MTNAAGRWIFCLTAMAASAVAGVGHAQTSGATVVLTQPSQDAWARVRQALTPEQQALEVRRFLSALAAANGRPITPALDARHIASGRAVSLDDPALLQRPPAHEVTLTVAGRFLVFRPLSRASLDPFLGR